MAGENTGENNAVAGPEGLARKDSAGKPRLSLIPYEALRGMALCLEYGYDKYGLGNWEKGGSWRLLADATLRHFHAWISGEDRDPGSGLSHLSHVLCNVAFLLAYSERHLGIDDRLYHLLPDKRPCP